MPEPGYFLNPNWWAMTVPTRGNEIAGAVWSGLQMLAPNTASLLSGEPAPPLPNLPATPGKVPSTIRESRALWEGLQIQELIFCQCLGPVLQVQAVGFWG